MATHPISVNSKKYMKALRFVLICMSLGIILNNLLYWCNRYIECTRFGSAMIVQSYVDTSSNHKHLIVDKTNEREYWELDTGIHYHSSSSDCTSIYIPALDCKYYFIGYVLHEMRIGGYTLFGHHVSISLMVKP